ncbi:MAG TPA: ABC transporter permease [Firmicutes bacterium]|nr:ABC transporter permease [Candidatus Fermentithermobacillaceae bacterium]
MHTKSAVLSTLVCLTLSTMVLTCITGVRGGLSDALERVLQTSRSYYYTVRFPNPPSGSGLTRAKAQELLEILARSDFAKDVACVRTLDLPLVYYTRESSPAPGVPLPGAILVGFATLNYPLVVGEKPAQGRWFTREEVDKGADVCVAHTGIVSKSRAQVGSDLFSALPFEVESPSPACIQLVGIFGYSDVDSRIHAYLPWNHPWAVMTSHERTEVIYYVQPKPGFAGSVIAVIGVIVALVSIVMIQGLGRVTEMNADKLIELGGRNGLVIQGYDPVDRVGLGIQRKFPVLDDFLQVRRLEDELGFKCAYLMSSIVNVASEENVVAVAVTGVAGEALKVKGLRAKWGTAEVGSGRCVLGYETARQLFGNPAKAVGRSVVVGDDVEVLVTGVLEPVPRGMVSKVVEPDETLYMPFEEAIRVRAFEVTPRGAEIFLRFGSEEALENGKERVISILPVENGIVAYKVTEPLKSLEEYKSFRAKSGRIFSLFGLIALVDSGIGILNYMVVEVFNRRREIAVLRAVGAPKAVIAGEVLREGLAIAGIGGLAAFVISAVILILMGNPLPVMEWLRLFGLALAISGALGILSGLVPAIIASNQDPLECLRTE